MPDWAKNLLGIVGYLIAGIICAIIAVKLGFVGKLPAEGTPDPEFYAAIAFYVAFWPILAFFGILAGIIAAGAYLCGKIVLLLLALFS